MPEKKPWEKGYKTVTTEAQPQAKPWEKDFSVDEKKKDLTSPTGTGVSSPLESPSASNFTLGSIVNDFSSYIDQNVSVPPVKQTQIPFTNTSRIQQVSPGAPFYVDPQTNAPVVGPEVNKRLKEEKEKYKQEVIYGDGSALKDFWKNQKKQHEEKILSFDKESSGELGDRYLQMRDNQDEERNKLIEQEENNFKDLQTKVSRIASIQAYKKTKDKTPENIAKNYYDIMGYELPKGNEVVFKRNMFGGIDKGVGDRGKLTNYSFFEAKANYELAGINAWETALNLTEESATDDESKKEIARQRADIETAKRNHIFNNNVFYTKQLERAISAEVNKEKNFFQGIFGGNNVSPEKIKEIAKRVGIDKGLTDEEAGFLADRVKKGEIPNASFLASAFYNLVGRSAVDLSGWLNRITSSDKDAVTEANEVYSKYVENYFAPPEDQQLYRTSVVGQRLQEEEATSNWNFDNGFLGNTKTVLRTMTDGAAQMYGYIGGGKAMATVIPGRVFSKLPAVKNAADRIAAVNNLKNEVGMLTYSFATTYEPYYRDAAQYTESSLERNVYATFKGLATAFSERLFPDERVIDDVIRKVNAKDFIGAVANKGPQAMLNKKTFKDVILNTAKNTGKEIGEEEVDLLAEAVLGAMILPGSNEDRNWWDEVSSTAVITALSSILPIGGSELMQRNNKPTKDVLEEIAFHPREYVEDIRNQVKVGAMNNEEGNRRIKVINTLEQVAQLSQMHNPKNRAEYIYDQLEKSFLEEQKKKAKGDPVLLEDIDRRIGELITKIKTNKQDAETTQTPGEVSTQTQVAETQAGTINSEETNNAQGKILNPEQVVGAFSLDEFVASQIEGEINPDETYVFRADENVIPTQLLYPQSFDASAEVSSIGKNRVSVKVKGSELQKMMQGKAPASAPVSTEQTLSQLLQIVRDQQVPQDERLNSLLDQARRQLSNDSQWAGKSSNSLIQAVFNAYDINDLESLNDDEQYTVFTDQETGSLASLVGANVTTTGNQVQVNISAGQLKQLNTLQNAPQESQEQKANERSVSGELFDPSQREQETSTGREIQPQTDRLPGDQRSEGQAQQKPKIRVRINPDGTISKIEQNENQQPEIISETQNTEPGEQQVEGTGAGQSRIEGPEGVFQLGPIKKMNSSGIVAGKTNFRNDTISKESETRFTKEKGDPVIVYRHNGKTYVLDGRARVKAAKFRGQQVEAREFKGTLDDAMRLAAMFSNKKNAGLKRAKLEQRINDLPDEEPGDFRGRVLRSMLGSFRDTKYYVTQKFNFVKKGKKYTANIGDVKATIYEDAGAFLYNGVRYDTLDEAKEVANNSAPKKMIKSRKRVGPLFSLKDFSSVIGFGTNKKAHAFRTAESTTQDEEVRMHLRTGMLVDDHDWSPAKRAEMGVTTFEQFLEIFFSENGIDDQVVNVMDYKQALADIIMGYPTFESVVASLEQMAQKETDPNLVDETETPVILSMTQEEMSIVSQEDLGDLIYEMSQLDANFLTPAELNYLDSLMMGSTNDVQEVVDAIINNPPNEIAKSIKDKLTKYVRNEYERNPSGLIGLEVATPSFSNESDESDGTEDISTDAPTDETEWRPQTGWRAVDEEAPFSKGPAGRLITSSEAGKLATALRKLFKNSFQIIIPDTNKFNQFLSVALNLNKSIEAKKRFDVAKRNYSKSQSELKDATERFDNINAVQTGIGDVSQLAIPVSKQERDSILNPLKEKLRQAKVEMEEAKKEFANSFSDPNQLAMFNKSVQEANVSMENEVSSIVEKSIDLDFMTDEQILESSDARQLKEQQNELINKMNKLNKLLKCK